MRRKVGGTRKTAKRKPTTHRRRRRIGSAGMGDIVNVVGGLTVGGAAGRMMATFLGNFISFLKTNQMADGALQIALGYFLPKMVKGQFMQFVGYGLIASGGQTFLVGTGVISGAADVMTYKLGGTSQLRVVGGTGNLKTVGYSYPGDNRVQNPQPVMQPVRAKNFQHYG